MLGTPGPPGERVEDDGLVIAAVVEAGVEVQGQVFRVVSDVDGEAGREAEVRVGVTTGGAWPETGSGIQLC